MYLMLHKDKHLWTFCCSYFFSVRCAVICGQEDLKALLQTLPGRDC